MIAQVIGFTRQEIDATMQSHERVGNAFPLLWQDAYTPDGADNMERGYGILWNHPTTGYAIIDGLRFNAYSGDWRKRRACFWSHYDLWEIVADETSPWLILESDAVFTRRFDPAELDGCPYGMVSLNDPRGATRLAPKYHFILQYHAATGGLAQNGLLFAPWVDEDVTIPQGLPGHSAYVLFPWFAKELLAKVAQVGAMPNDALANKQWFPGKLGCLTRYATKVSGRPSTLT